MTTEITTRTLEVRRDDWSQTRIDEAPVPAELAENDVLLRVERLALTANNISYAATGDSLGYWGFFPADDGWGRIPAMGWAEVIASEHPEVAPGERVWGWFPYSTHLRITAGKVNPATITDVSAHRAEYAPVYAQFDRASANPLYESAREDQDSLLRGLFMTSWLVEDFLHVNEFFGARACLITSASSKTSIALGHSVHRRGELESIGITSAGNKAFCENLGCYDRVVVYEDVEDLDASQPVVMVDMAGSAKLLSTLHHHFTDNMKHSCRIGATHIQDSGPVADLPGARPEFFFAPTHVKQRSDDLGRKELMQRMGMAYAGFRAFADDWLTVQQSCGPDAATRTYLSVLSGKTEPASGQIISLWPEKNG